MFFSVDKKLNYGREQLSALLSNIKFDTPEPIILDIGAGDGVDLMSVRRKFPGASLHAVDAIENKSTKLINQGIKVYLSDIESDKLPFASESVDFIIANQIFEHCKNVFWIMHEISRVLKVGGHVYIGVPNLASLHNRFLLFLGKQPTCINSRSAHVRGFTRPDLRAFVETVSNQSYKEKDFFGSNFYPFSPFLARWLSRFFPSFSVCIFLLFRKLDDCGDAFLQATDGLATNFKRM
jgi:ubiquinone/menaquinone biosynthesis C-methylase UbiE